VPGATAAAPDGQDLGALIERMRGAGLSVRCDLDGVPAGEVAAVTYRLVQESLTNVIRHAPGAGATVHVRADDGGVDVDVLDDGPGPGRQIRPGYGLVGIDERVRRLGGQFSAGWASGGQGFHVHARIPVRSVSQV
jgi:signal transduction histidine kinase